MSVRAAIADYLEANDVIALYSFHDAAPDEAVGLFPYSAEPGEYTKTSRYPILTRNRVQVVCRAATEEAAENLATSVHLLLDGAHRELGLTSIRALQAPFRNPGGSDSEGRIAWIFNLAIIQ